MPRWAIWQVAASFDMPNAYTSNTIITSMHLSSMLWLIEENGFGYQLRAIAKPWPVEASFQDISIYCYRK
ncbi:MAG: hypothetical protein WA756_19875 [Pseudolabrys sp.]